MPSNSSLADENKYASRERGHRRRSSRSINSRESRLRRSSHRRSTDRHSSRRSYESSRLISDRRSRSHSNVTRSSRRSNYDKTRKYASKESSRSRGESLHGQGLRRNDSENERRGSSSRSRYRSYSRVSDSKKRRCLRSHSPRAQSPEETKKSETKRTEEEEEKKKASSKSQERDTSVSSTKKSKRTGWDSGPAPLPSLLPSLTNFGVTGTNFSASLAGKTPEQIQEELAERQAQAASIAATMQMRASTSQLCRIYVGSLDYSLTENDIRQVFSAFGPITNVDMPKEGNRSKGFCFVEYATPESANMAITTMPGFNLKGRAIKVGRPTALGGQSNNALTSMSMLLGGGLAPKAAGVNAAEAGQIAAAMLLAKADQSGMNQTDSQCRIYVGSVPYSFTCDDIKQIFDVFGKILSCQLIPSNERPGTHRGYGFIEYSSVDEARLAIETMNDFSVAGKVLKVNYATALRGAPGLMSLGYTTPPSAPLAATGANAVPVISQLMNTAPAQTTMSSLMGQNPASLTTSLPTVDSKSSTAVENNVIVLCNMVTKSEANDELKDEIQQECSKYGVVKRVEIVPYETTDDVRIFVEFEAAKHASVAIPSLHDRWFGGRRIIAKPYDTAAFAAQNYWM